MNLSVASAEAEERANWKDKQGLKLTDWWSKHWKTKNRNQVKPVGLTG